MSQSEDVASPDCQSIRASMQAEMHDITALLAMAMRQPEPKTC